MKIKPPTNSTVRAKHECNISNQSQLQCIWLVFFMSDYPQTKLIVYVIKYKCMYVQSFATTGRIA